MLRETEETLESTTSDLNRELSDFDDQLSRLDRTVGKDRRELARLSFS